MKLQATMTIAILTAMLTSTSANAGSFNLGKSLQTAQNINHAVKVPNYGGNPGNGSKKGFIGKPAVYPGNNGKYGGIGKPVIYQKPIYKPLPVYPPIYCKPVPPVWKPAPPVCIKPIPVCPKCHGPVCHCPKLPPVCKVPINRPPVKLFTMKLMNNAGADVFFSLNAGVDFTTLVTNDVELIKSVSPKGLQITYHNGQEVVEYDLDPMAAYSFEWQGETLMLLEMQG